MINANEFRRNQEGAQTMNNEPVILITGAGKGIGQAVVQEILIRKAQIGGNPKLLLTARTLSDLTELKTQAAKAQVECEILPLELADSPNAPVDAILKKYGRLDFLIHSAGVGIFKPFLDQTKEDLSHTLRTNVTAMFFLMQRAYAQMKLQKSGHMICITSVAAEKPFLESSSYCLSKYAQHGLIEVMPLSAYQDGIKITEVKPGAVHTPMWGNIPEAMIQKMMTPKQVAQSIVDVMVIPGTTTIEELKLRPNGGFLIPNFNFYLNWKMIRTKLA